MGVHIIISYLYYLKQIQFFKFVLSTNKFKTDFLNKIPLERKIEFF